MQPAQPATELRTIHLRVKHHPGVMLHVCSLLTRKNFSTEEFSFAPDPAGNTAAIRLTTRETARFDQMLRQLEKLHDTLEVTVK